MPLSNRKIQEKYDSQFLIDRERIINSVAFRRLEYKTQVFVNHIGDHYRTRLTHTLEVAHIARILARNTGLNEDYMEVLALAHDLGHPPFGHAGEEALNEVTKIVGGFDHNAQTLRTVAVLEHHSGTRRGLELSNETLIGIAKHNSIEKLHPKLKTLCANLNLDLASLDAPEIELASLADDIAYISHDIDDGLRMGVLDISEVLKLDSVKALTNEMKFAEQDATILGKMLSHQIRKVMIADLTTQTTQNEMHFSENIEAHRIAIKEYLMQKVYKHYKINRMCLKAKKVVRELFDTFKYAPECLPQKWQLRIDPKRENLHEVIIDYIAGMTDRFAIKEHRNLLDPSVY